jgi:hypothetical protein
MGPLTPSEMQPRLETPQVRRYAQAIDRDSAHEMLTARMQPAEAPAPAEVDEPLPDEAEAPEAPAEPQGGGFMDILNSPIARTIAGQVTRGLMGALLGRAPRAPSAPRRRRRRY